MNTKTIKKIFKNTLLSLLLLFCTSLSLFAQEEIEILVVYPKPNSEITAKSTFIIGSSEPGSKILINNKPAKVYTNGSFVEIFPLKPGENTITVKSSKNGRNGVLSYNISTPEKPKTIPHKPLIIDELSITPQKNIICKPGDIISVQFTGSTGYDGVFNIDGVKNIQMKEITKAGQKGIYKGYYTVKQKDNFKNAKIFVRLKNRFTRLTKHSSATVSTLKKENYLIGKIKANNTTVRVAPKKARLTPLEKSTLIAITGQRNGYYRFKKTNNKQSWTPETGVNIIEISQIQPSSEIKNINVFEDKDSIFIKIPLNEKLPVDLNEQKNSIILDIYGAKANIDQITYNHVKSIKEINWEQPNDNSFRLKIEPEFQQLWGYRYFFFGNDLVLKIRKTPKINPINPLKGQIIAIDPGHGADELGAVGPTGIPEKTVNLRIFEHLKKELEKNGAIVITTRETDDINPDLYERSEIARKNNAIVLLSIHNNALPDGKNPYKTHGTSVYYYHSQALPLAKSLQNDLVTDLEFKDLGVFWGSLALTRPTEPVSVLLEIAFMIHPDEYAKIITPAYQKLAAKSITKSLKNYFLQKGEKQ